MDDIRLIVGLGNPGRKYHRTRHNAGFDTIDLLAQKLAVEMNKEKFSAVFGRTDYKGKKLILLKPLEFMNNSGSAAAAAAKFYKIEPKDMLVISDEMALEPGVIRLRPAGTAGGHNGLADVIKKMATDQFCRLRIGIGKATLPDTKGYVLARPDDDDWILIDRAIEKAAEAVLSWVSCGIDEAMNKFN